jgi:hypothetical protein
VQTNFWKKLPPTREKRRIFLVNAYTLQKNAAATGAATRMIRPRQRSGGGKAARQGRNAARAGAPLKKFPAKIQMRG